MSTNVSAVAGGNMYTWQSVVPSTALSFSGIAVNGQSIPIGLEVDNSSRLYDLFFTEETTGWELYIPAGTRVSINMPGVKNAIFSLSLGTQQLTDANPVTVYFYDFALSSVGTTESNQSSTNQSLSTLASLSYANGSGFFSLILQPSNSMLETEYIEVPLSFSQMYITAINISIPSVKGTLPGGSFSLILEYTLAGHHAPILLLDFLYPLNTTATEYESIDLIFSVPLLIPSAVANPVTFTFTAIPNLGSFTTDFTSIINAAISYLFV